MKKYWIFVLFAVVLCGLGVAFGKRWIHIHSHKVTLDNQTDFETRVAIPHEADVHAKSQYENTEVRHYNKLPDKVSVDITADKYGGLSDPGDFYAVHEEVDVPPGGWITIVTYRHNIHGDLHYSIYLKKIKRKSWRMKCNVANTGGRHVMLDQYTFCVKPLFGGLAPFCKSFGYLGKECDD